MEEISFEESRKIKNALYVDVRSPIEFEEDHIPGAVNLPIFSDDERKEIGTLYKMAGKSDAIKKGTEVGGRRIVDIINTLSAVREREIIIYCARGGMRSAAVASLVNSLGIRALRIRDGYRSYRKMVMERLSAIEIKPAVFVLQGLTGAGKTEILRFIPESVDLEQMAGHRSSIFGGIGLKQNSQKGFETLLLKRLDELEDSEYVIFEGESKKVGNLHIPENIFIQMRRAPAIFIETPIERRIEIIKREYTGFNEDEKILNTVSSLRSKLGNEKTDMLLELYNRGEIDRFIENLLIDYYDSLYRHTLDRLTYIEEIVNNNSEEASRAVIETARRAVAAGKTG